MRSNNTSGHARLDQVISDKEDQIILLDISQDQTSNTSGHIRSNNTSGHNYKLK